MIVNDIGDVHWSVDDDGAVVNLVLNPNVCLSNVVTVCVMHTVDRLTASCLNPLDVDLVHVHLLMSKKEK